MHANVGTADRISRYAAAAILLSLAVFGVIGGGLAAAAMIIAAILILTSLFSFCPLYRLLGLNSCRS
ncbi:YgaP family membrane protein [Sphingomicrobium lutaoense]|uniref:Inner membrane protein YgaP-like transmembrane domain-containing protein n=1 Tax=Sphingomicrobium lutaoense TaxID=515949 RepID=A0A839Z7R6_9SPHN|nr:DUF2892 domain-containing protein [Sphingomicrobium lutaoense]MBB3764924.1 hypothetical protein [Sphingomicrobium lutaoense]